MSDNLVPELFEWQDVCTTYFNGNRTRLFKDCTVVQPFGPFKKDEHVAWIELDYDHSRIVCENEAEEQIFEGRLVLGVE